MHLGKHHHKIHAFTATLTLLVVFLAASTGWAPKSLADYNHNPLGNIDYCTLSGNTTTIHGWAHDPDAPAGAYPHVIIQVGSQSQTVNTSIAGYHDTVINQYITRIKPYVPHSTTYGFTASFSGLYKGTAYGVSGIAINYGAGTGDRGLIIDYSGTYYDGINVPTRFTAAKTVPDSCLATRPTPPPVPIPSPTPTPTPVTHRTTHTPTPSNPSTNASAATQTGNADGTVAAGTLSASVTVPTDSAQSIYVLYGTSADTLVNSSDTVTAAGDKEVVTLTTLTPKTTYYYQIVRMSTDNQLITSPPQQFATTGYAITLHLVDAQKKPIANIPGVINDSDNTTTKSDKNGDLKFFNLDPGAYTVKYQYHNLVYSKDFDTASVATDANSNGKTAVLSDTIDVSTLKNGSGKPLSSKKQSSIGTILLLLFFIIVIGGAIVWLVLRRRKLSQNTPYASSFSAAGPGVIDIPTPKLAHLPKTPHKQPVVAQEPLDHVGESLREMVVRSMHEEAQKRKQNS